jgi:Yip1 domain
MGEVTLPADWQWWTTEMQNNYTQAMQATQGPVFLYVIPSITGLAGLWLGWGILGAMFHLVSTLFGGRGKMASALNVLAWASLPFGVRDVLQVVFMLVTRHTIASPGLSGFISGTSGWALFAANLLKHVDVYLAWYAILLILGFSRVDSLPKSKAIANVLVVLLLSLAAQAGLGALLSRLSGMMITRPLF